MRQFDIKERYAAYRSTLLEHGVEPDPRLLYEADSNYEDGAADAAKRMLEDGLPSTAVVAATDLNAMSIMNVLKAAGCVLPQDQAVVGFDDNPDSALLTPSLSSVSQNPDRIGALAAELLLAQLAGEVVAPGRYVVPTSFVARKSCGCTTSDELKRAASRDHDPVGVLGRTVSPAATVFDSASQFAVQELSTEVGEIYRRAAREGPSDKELSRLGHICEDLYYRDPSQLTYNAIMALTSSLESTAVPGESQSPGDTARWLAQCSAQVRLSLTAAVLELHNNDYYKLRKFVRDEYQITVDLLKGDDPRSLRWLRSTDADQGVLALWRDTGDHSMPSGRGPRRHNSPLDIAGTFTAPEGTARFSSATYAASMFPPEEMIESAATQDKVTLVFPLQSEERDWGFLAVAQDVGSRLGQEAYFMWSELLGQVLSHKAMAQEVRDSEERYALASQATNDGLWDWDLNQGSIYFSFRWKQMLGYPEGEIGNDPHEWLSRAHPDDLVALESELSALKSGECDSVLNEHRVRARDGTYLWMLCRGLAVPGQGEPATRLVGSLTDITERRSLEDRLRQQALYDGLTGLANRTLFLERLSQAVERAHSAVGYMYAVIWLDLDNFKNLNDELGHMYGDKLLVQVAERIRKHIRRTDTAARFGGDEFVVLVQGSDAAASLGTVVRRLSDSLNEPYDLSGQMATVTASVGIAKGTAAYDRPEEILRDADIAMYQAKSKRSGACVTFDKSMIGSTRSVRDRANIAFC